MRISFWALLGSYMYFPSGEKTTFKEEGGVGGVDGKITKIYMKGVN